jgi:hypothetical protein
MGATPGDAGNRITRVATASAKPFLKASVHIASAIESPGHQGTQVLRVARSVPYKRPWQGASEWKNCVVGLKCLHTWYNSMTIE